MRRLLAANFAHLRKIHLFWGTILLHAAFGIFRIHTLYRDIQTGYYTVSLDDALFSHILIEGVIMAVFIAVFMGTEYSDGTIRNKVVAGHERIHIYLANLIAVTAACFLFIAVYLVTALAAGIPVMGGPVLGAKAILITSAGTLVTAVSFCSLYTLIGMVFSSKSTGCIICILLYFSMMICTTYCAARLDAPPESLRTEMVDGELVSSMKPNPKYPSERQRAVYQFVLDCLPTGQSILYATLGGEPVTMVLYSCAIILLTTGGGVLYFRGKDLR